MIKETISPVQNTGAQMSQEKKTWFYHSQMIANIMSARMKELGMTATSNKCSELIIYTLK